MSSSQAPRRPDAATPMLVQERQLAGENQPPRHEEVRHDGGESFSWPTVIGFLFLTFNSGMAIYRSQGDPWAIAFVLFSYADLTLLFGCLRLYEHTDPNLTRRDLTTMLTAVFSYKVAAIMPLPVAMLVWAMAFCTVAGGYYAFFLHSRRYAFLHTGRCRV